MIYGIGTDIVELSRVKETYSRFGEKFTKNNIKIVRPSLGIEPKYFEKILGKTAKINLKFATALKWKYIKN